MASSTKPRGGPSGGSVKAGSPAKAPGAAAKAAASPTPDAPAAKPAATAPKGAEPETAATRPVRRRDATGHLDPAYAASLLALSGEGREPHDDRAFLERARSNEPLAEQLGEEFVTTVTSGGDMGEELLDQESVEERGGPFVETSGRTEFARGTDASNPRSAEREPFPTT